jgi:hypothetical protein
VCRVQVHDCILEMARAESKRISYPASWSLSSFSSTTRLPQVHMECTCQVQSSDFETCRTWTHAFDRTGECWSLGALLLHRQCSFAQRGLRLHAADI